MGKDISSTAYFTTLTASPKGALFSKDTVDVDAKTLTLRGESGVVNFALADIEFDAGGTASFVKSGPKYVAYFSAVPTTKDPFIGVAGFSTPSENIPIGVAQFAQSDGARVTIISDTAFYELTGAMAARVDFDAGIVDVTLNNLNGTRVDGASAKVSNVGALDISNAKLNGADFSGGEAEFTSLEIAKSLSGNEQISTAGALFGPKAQEIGGTFVIDDTAFRDLMIMGYFVGQ